MTKRVPDVVRNAMDAGLGIVLLKFLVGLVIVLSVTGHLKSVLRPFHTVLAGKTSAGQPRTGVLQETPDAEALRSSPATSENPREYDRKVDETTQVFEPASSDL